MFGEAKLRVQYSTWQVHFISIWEVTSYHVSFISCTVSSLFCCHTRFSSPVFHHFQPSRLLGTQWEDSYVFYHPTVPPMPGRHGRADCHDSFCYHRLWCCLRQWGQRFVQSFASGLGFWHGHLGLGLFDWTPLWWPNQLRCDLVFGVGGAGSLVPGINQLGGPVAWKLAGSWPALRGLSLWGGCN